jgi:hypothetical protein
MADIYTLLAGQITGQQPTPGYTIPTGGEVNFSVTLAAGQTLESHIVIDSAYDFLWITKSGDWTDKRFLVQFTYPGNDGYQQQNEPAAGVCALGQGAFALPLAVAYLCRGGAKIKYKLINNSGANNTINITFGGIFFRASA